MHLFAIEINECEYAETAITGCGRNKALKKVQIQRWSFSPLIKTFPTHLSSLPVIFFSADITVSQETILEMMISWCLWILKAFWSVLITGEDWRLSPSSWIKDVRTLQRLERTLHERFSWNRSVQELFHKECFRARRQSNGSTVTMLSKKEDIWLSQASLNASQKLRETSWPAPQIEAF